ncbi:hypothetical protein ASF30_01010 [Leifsonia sp. Leaf264]|nr:hypothetical protein ASF30_01010 [Leifsonia sp. Leaf264]
MLRRNRIAAGVIVAAGASLVLSACMSPTPAPTPTPTTTSAAPTATPTPTTPAVPVLKPGLSADENLAYFDMVNNAVIAANANAGGRDFVDALVAGGFDKAAMQVTPDRTAVDLQADSIQWSVLFNSECLVGQYGPASGGYHGIVADPTGQGACLLGETRPIDW